MIKSPLIIGNWKLHGNKSMIINFITSLKNEINYITGCKVIIAPPEIYLHLSKQLLEDSNFILGAQNVDVHLSGAFTGEVSVEMLKDIGAKYIIIGHSERRIYHKEDNEYILKKFCLVKQHGLIPVLCIGENKEEKENNKTKIICSHQLDIIINSLGISSLDKVVIAYEPIWAIGTGKSALYSEINTISQFIRDYISNYNTSIAKTINIVYGGSVNTQNVNDILTLPEINGVLVGSLSLNYKKFSEIVKLASKLF